LCEKIWGGSPATVQIHGGFESTEITGDVNEEVTNVTSLGSNLHSKLLETSEPQVSQGQAHLSAYHIKLISLPKDLDDAELYHDNIVLERNITLYFNCNLRL
jgi:hypothetical protein